MLKNITFFKDCRCFKKNETFELRPLTVFIGDQGTGKTTLLREIRSNFGDKKWGSKTTEPSSGIEKEGEMKLFSFDFEHENPRTLPFFDNDIQSQVNSMFSSHGQSIIGIFGKIFKLRNHIIVLDEPDMALSIKTILILSYAIKKHAINNQIIMSCHNPLMMEAFDEVYSLDHKMWMNPHDYIVDQKNKFEEMKKRADK